MPACSWSDRTLAHVWKTFESDCDGRWSDRWNRGGSRRIHCDDLRCWLEWTLGCRNYFRPDGNRRNHVGRRCSRHRRCRGANGCWCRHRLRDSPSNRKAQNSGNGMRRRRGSRTRKSDIFIALPWQIEGLFLCVLPVTFFACVWWIVDEVSGRAGVFSQALGIPVDVMPVLQDLKFWICLVSAALAVKTYWGCRIWINWKLKALA